MNNKFLCFFVLFLCVLTIFLFIFCSCEEPIKQESQVQSNRFLLLSRQDCSGDDFKVYVDRETRVQYIVIRGLKCVDIQLLIDENGNPLLYEGDFDK